MAGGSGFGGNTFQQLGDQIGTANAPSSGGGLGSAGAPPPPVQGLMSPYGGNSMVNSTNSTTTADMTGVSRSPLNGGIGTLFNNMQNQMSQPMVPQVQQPAVSNNVSDLYKNVLGREADAGGLSYWQGQVDKGMSLGDVEKAFRASDEFKNRPAQQPQQPAQTQPQPPQAPQQQGQQGGKAGGFGQPQTQNPYQAPSPVFMPQVNQSGDQMDAGTGGDMPQARPQQFNPYQVQNPYQGMLQNSYNQMINPYMQQERMSPYQQQFRQQYNPLSYRPNMEQVQQNLKNVKPSVYTNELAEVKAKLKEYEDAKAASSVE